MPLWSTVTLATDADLKQVESQMPELGQRTVNGAGKTAYDGKRQLTKDLIANWLGTKQFNPDYLASPATELRFLAIFWELSLIYRDMAQRGDSVSAEKADYYLEQSKQQRDSLLLTYEPPASGDNLPDRVPVMIPWLR